MEVITIFSKIVPVLLLIFVGGLIRTVGFLQQKTIDDLKKIVVNISLPALLFMAFAETNFELRYLLIIFSVFASCGVMLLIGIGFKKIFKYNNPYFPSLFSGFETGMMGYSIYVAVFGAANMHKLALIDLGQVTFVFLVLTTYLQRQNGQTVSIRNIGASFIKSPVILAIALGICIGAIGVIDELQAFTLSNSVLETITLLSNLTVPIICIVIGFELRIDVKNIIKPLSWVVTRMLLLLGLGFMINELVIDGIMHFDPSYKVALYTMFLLPPPFVIPIFMQDSEEENKQFVLNTISLHILLSLFAFLIMMVVIK